MEWSLVLGEIKSFIEADTVVNVLDSDSNSIILSYRLNPLITPPVERSPIMTISLQEVIIVGNVTDQVKFSELTLDMFRMLQTLEREPQDDLTQVSFDLFFYRTYIDKYLMVTLSKYGCTVYTVYSGRNFW